MYLRLNYDYCAVVFIFLQQAGLLLAPVIQLGGLEWISGIRPGCLVSKPTLLKLF